MDEATEDLALDKVPFHKHPRWIRLQRELKEAREALAKKSEVSAPQTVQQVAQSDEEYAPAEFVKLFGDNPEAWKLFKRMKDSDRQQYLQLAEQRFESLMARQQEEQQRQEESRKQILSNLENELADMSDDAGVDLTNPRSTVRNQILNIVDEYGLFDGNGVPNLRAAYKLHQKIYAKPSQDVEEKRKIVAKTGAKTNSNVEESMVFTQKRIKEIQRKGGISFLENL